MTVTYPNGTDLKAIVLSHGELDIRSVAAGSDDVLTFTRIHGTWISEDGDPVTIEFSWQRHGASHRPSENDCICAKELAARLIQHCSMAASGTKRNRARFFFRPVGTRVVIQRTERGALR
jgi:hypothetical protein